MWFSTRRRSSSRVWPGDWVPALGEPYGRDTFIALARGRPYANGALINEVAPGSLAARMDPARRRHRVGHPIGDSADFARGLLGWRWVEPMRLTVFRDGEYRHLKPSPEHTGR
jgi:hypothetical protein